MKPNPHHTYLCVNPGQTYLREGETYTAELIGRRDVYLRNVARGSGTTVRLWELDPRQAGRALVVLQAVQS